ncbi:nicotinate phosphoribosyltransferase [Pokkaliibacter plantistimulans]|uniref:Nicotinamide phosphoribosyltransferase n=1 Tax=Proteobacteria bacterium 228 TaxID=2083153 RepID=A0A2S5KLI7_9PROT|nr:nicotinate phosphoribosyltransferase [Pokkaliibacter plantistimulans]PPC75600.1 nicotinate phosphoribosyltransferase [Pokkaliibacter plantistimulans]
MKMNLILNTDSYKLSHFLQYPRNTQYIFSYIESRGGLFDDVLFFGLQKALMDLNEHFPTLDDLEEARAIAAAHGEPFNEAGWKALIALGYFPLAIKAVPEGSILPTRNILLGIVNTLPEFFWLPGHLEPLLLRGIWYPTTVSTLSYHIKQTIGRFMQATCDTQDGLPFKLHDFGARGASSEESAGIGGMAHLVNFMGTDTLSALRYARRYYAADMAGYSIPASEHSTITAWGRANEAGAYRNLLRQFPTGLVACVSDSYDIYNAVDSIWGDELRMDISERDGTVVIRPDSGDPVKVIPVLLKRLGKRFGYRLNSKGYKVLNNKVRIIQGDGVNLDSIERILRKLMAKRWSTDNIAFGMGGALLQGVDRDTQRFAMKASAVCVDGEWRAVYKDPITDSGKKSKRGVLDLINGHTVQVSIEQFLNQPSDLRLVYKDGEILIRDDFDSIRARAAASYPL